MKKQEWLNENVWVDEYGRPYNLSDVPMTVMTRNEAYKKRKLDKKVIDKLYKEDLEIIKGTII